MQVAYLPVAERWSSLVRFVIVCAAALITLGDVWRLPYLLATYGGGAFLLVYAAALALLGLPILSAQLLMARGLDVDVPGVVAAWTRDGPHSRWWSAGAFAALAGALLLVAAYAVVASWSLAYCLRALLGALASQGMDASTHQFVSFARDGERGFGWLILFVLLLVATAARGLRSGIEPIMRTLAGALLFILLILLLVAIWQAPLGATCAQLFAVHFGALGARGVLEALYQAFFSLSLGTGVILALASRLPSNAPVIRLSVALIVSSQLAALALVVVLVSFLPGGVAQLGAGAQRVFEVVPAVVAPSWVSALWFLVPAIVCMTTGIGLFEPLVQLVEQRAGIPRLNAAIYAGVGVAALGLLAQNAFGALAGWQIFGCNIFEIFSRISSQLLIPATGLALCVLVGRVLAREQVMDAWHGTSGDRRRAAGFRLWHGLLRYPARIAMIAVLVYALGLMRVVDWIWGT